MPIEITNLTSKPTPVDADSFILVDSVGTTTLKKLTWSNLKTTLKTYLDTLYVALTGTQTIAGAKTFSGQTELTGQAATSDTSAMTRELGDVRYGRELFSLQGAAITKTSDTSAQTMLSQTVEAGTYKIEVFCVTNVTTGGAAGGGAYTALNFPSSSAITGLKKRHAVGSTMSGAYQFLTSGSSSSVVLNAGGSDYTDAQWTAGIALQNELVAVLTAGAVTFQVRQNTSSATSTNFPAGGSYMRLTRMA